MSADIVRIARALEYAAVLEVFGARRVKARAGAPNRVRPTDRVTAVTFGDVSIEVRADPEMPSSIWVVMD